MVEASGMPKGSAAGRSMCGGARTKLKAEAFYTWTDKEKLHGRITPVENTSKKTSKKCDCWGWGEKKKKIKVRKGNLKRKTLKFNRAIKGSGREMAQCARACALHVGVLESIPAPHGFLATPRYGLEDPCTAGPQQ